MNQVFRPFGIVFKFTLSLAFSIGSWTCGTLYQPLPVRQGTNIASFKSGVREFLAGNV